MEFKNKFININVLVMSIIAWSEAILSILQFFVMLIFQEDIILVLIVFKLIISVMAVRYSLKVIKNNKMDKQFIKNIRLFYICAISSFLIFNEGGVPIILSFIGLVNNAVINNMFTDLWINIPLRIAFVIAVVIMLRKLKAPKTCDAKVCEKEEEL